MAAKNVTRTKKTRKKTSSKKKAAPKKKAASKKKSSSKKKAAPKKKAASKKKASSKKKAAPKKKATPKKKAASKKKAAPKKKAASKKKAKSKKETPAKKTKEDKKSSTASKKKSSTGGKRRRLTVQEAVINSEADDQGYVIINGRRIRKIITDPDKMPKKKRSSAGAVTDSRAKIDVSTLKTPLSKPELKEFETLLLDKRRELFHAVDSMETEALRSDDGDTSNMPIHMADVGSDAYEQDLMLGMAESERTRIKEIDEALIRIRDKTYGVCELTGEPIRQKRLIAKPWAKYSIGAKRQIERGIRA